MGFSNRDILVYEITDPTNPAQILNLEIESEGNAFRLSFADDGDGPKTHLVLMLAEQKSPVRIEKNVPSNLRSMDNGGDYIIIAHPLFLSKLR